MTDPADRKRRASYQDVINSPEHMVAEIVAGELHLSNRPAGLATGVASAMGAELGMAFGRGRGGPGGWIILFEPELHLGEDVVVPDLAGWKRDRLPVIPDKAFLTVAPDWICEVLSPSTARLDRAVKLPLYASSGVGHAWIVDPRRRTLEVFRNHQGKWLMVGAHVDLVRVRIEPFEAIEIDLASWWSDVALPDRAREAPGEYAFEGF